MTTKVRMIYAYFYQDRILVTHLSSYLTIQSCNVFIIALFFNHTKAL